MRFGLIHDGLRLDMTIHFFLDTRRVLATKKELKDLSIVCKWCFLFVLLPRAEDRLCSRLVFLLLIDS